MEFPTVGANCALPLCRSLSFLPFQCPFCSKVHCPEHRLPQDHVCSQWSMESHANSVHLCPKCERMVLVPKQHDSATVLREHQDSDCSIHLLPPVQSIAVLCSHRNCNRQDRVVVTCPDCSKIFCLRHRHGTNHECSKINELEQEAQAKNQKMQALKASIADTFVGKDKTPDGKHQQRAEDEIQKAEKTKARADAAKAALAAAKARAAARTAASTSGSASSTIPVTTGKPPAPVAPKVKKASRVVTVAKLRKNAQSWMKKRSTWIRCDTTRLASGKLNTDLVVYANARYDIKAWNVGRTLDKVVNLLKFNVPKSDDFDAQKRLSIFHGKEPEDIPTILNMQDRLQEISSIENGDIFHVAPADWEWPTK
ncbi:MAG: hypothetical protein J3Q66DRAFT_366015 [Benniella sp.]|nr:MAG: hypothetical protein J3Q66DRAFT_366015 [Benniella sp.]